MIKIEKLSETAIATIEGNQVLLGQLLTKQEFDLLVLTVGSITVSIDENELLVIAAPQPIVPVVPPIPVVTTVPEVEAPTLEVPLAEVPKIETVKEKSKVKVSKIVKAV